MIKNIQHTVTAVILNDKNQVLGVSRKGNITDMGLVGGKVDETDDTFEDAMYRETMEETGLTIDTNTMVERLSMPKHMNGNTYWGHTYLIRDWYGEIQTDEPHVVKWTDFDELLRGSFGKWNNIVREILIDLGVL